MEVLNMCCAGIIIRYNWRRRSAEKVRIVIFDILLRCEESSLMCCVGINTDR